MLAEIHSKGFALFDDIDVEFSIGMNVVTGETGAGKSLFLSVLKVLTGERPPFVKGKSEVEALFFESNGKEIVVSLKISPSRMTARMNGSIVTLAQLRERVNSLMTIHAQGTAGILRNPKMHARFVDLFKPSIPSNLDRYRKLYHEYLGIKRAFDASDVNTEDVDEEIKDLEREAEKIETILPSEEEYESMVSEYKKLLKARDVIRTAKEINYIISEEGGLEDIFQVLAKKLRELKTIDSKAQSFLDFVEPLEEDVHSLSRDVERYADSQEIDEEKLEKLEDMITDIERIKRRYGPTFDDVKEKLKAIHERIAKLRKVSNSLKKSSLRLKELKDEMWPLALKIKKARSISANELLKRTEENLRDLGMPNTLISFSQHDTEFTENGIDQLEFIGRLNPGTPEMPISEIASGGEISRIYLALEAALGEKLPISTLVFDEVETGVGARTADVLAQKLKEISKSTQLIVITHMPQIAAMADKHFKVEKRIDNGKTISSVIELGSDTRKKEISAMFGKIPKGV